jgi:spermidine/putrescine transport system substrate-binding protein
MRQAAGRATGYDIASPTAEYVPGMVEQGFVQKLDKSRIPNLANINPKFKGLWWDPNDEYQIPRTTDDRRPVSHDDDPTSPQSWKDFYGLVKGPASARRLRRLDGRRLRLPAQDARLLAQLRREGELDEAREILLDVAPHLLRLDSNNYGEKMADGEAR